VPAELVIGPVEARVSAHFAPRTASARESLLEALDSGRYITLLDELDQFLSDLPGAAEAGRPARDTLPAAVKRAGRRVRKRARQAVQAPAGPARETALHETRKSAKEVRYGAECAATALGREAARLAKRAKQVQSVLGDQHDAVVARDTVRDIAVRAHLAGENSFSFGLVHAGCQHDANLLACQGNSVWDRMLRPEYAKWLA
jgi:CHAD domain-containing protein